MTYYLALLYGRTHTHVFSHNMICTNRLWITKKSNYCQESIWRWLFCCCCLLACSKATQSQSMFIYIIIFPTTIRSADESRGSCAQETKTAKYFRLKWLCIYTLLTCMSVRVRNTDSGGACNLVLLENYYCILYATKIYILPMPRHCETETESEDACLDVFMCVYLSNGNRSRFFFVCLVDTKTSIHIEWTQARGESNISKHTYILMFIAEWIAILLLLFLLLLDVFSKELAVRRVCIVRAANARSSSQH